MTVIVEVGHSVLTIKDVWNIPSLNFATS